jgi:hypothetical protein
MHSVLEFIFRFTPTKLLGILANLMYISIDEYYKRKINYRVQQSVAVFERVLTANLVAMSDKICLPTGNEIQSSTACI